MSLFPIPRITRTKYITINLTISLINYLIGYAIGHAIGRTNNSGAGLLLIFLLIPLAVGLYVTVGRLKDIDSNPWLSTIPLLSLFLFLIPLPEKELFLSIFLIVFFYG